MSAPIAVRHRAPGSDTQTRLRELPEAPGNFLSRVVRLNQPDPLRCSGSMQTEPMSASVECLSSCRISMDSNHPKGFQPLVVTSLGLQMRKTMRI